MPRLIRPRRIPVQTRPLSPASRALLEQSDRELMDPDLVARSTVRQLRRTINRVPRAEQGVDWVERVVSIYAVKGEKGRRCAALMLLIEKERRKAKAPEKFEAFKTRLTEQLGKTNPDGTFYMTFEFSDPARALKDLAEVIDTLTAKGIPAFINSGTLLGAVREGGFIKHDYDADVAVIVKGQTDEELVDSFNRIYGLLKDTYGPILRPRLKAKRPVIKVKMKSGLVIDLFPVWERDGRAYVWPHTFGELTMDDILPFSTAPINGMDFPVPKEAEKMLALNYGPDWREPDPVFEFPWDAAKQKFATTLAAYERDTKRRVINKFLFRKSLPEV